MHSFARCGFAPPTRRLAGLWRQPFFLSLRPSAFSLCATQRSRYTRRPSLAHGARASPQRGRPRRPSDLQSVRLPASSPSRSPLQRWCLDRGVQLHDARGQGRVCLDNVCVSATDKWRSAPKDLLYMNTSFSMKVTASNVGIMRRLNQGHQDGMNNPPFPTQAASERSVPTRGGRE